MSCRMLHEIHFLSDVGGSGGNLGDKIGYSSKT